MLSHTSHLIGSYINQTTYSMVILLCLITLKTIPQMLTSAMSCAGTYQCSSSVMILRCGTTEEIAGVVQHYNLVEAVGAGHSQ